jgi:hypothetical protein
MHAFLFSPMRATWLAHLTLLQLITNYIWWVDTMKLFLTEFSPVSCYFLPRGQKYIPQYLLLQQTQPIFFPKETDHVSHPYTF